MAIRVKKSVLVIGGIVGVVVIAAAGVAAVLIAQRLRVEEDVTPEESEASNNCCDDPTYGLYPCDSPDDWNQGYEDCLAENCPICEGGPSCSAVGEACSSGAHCTQDVCCSGLICYNGQCANNTGQCDPGCTPNGGSCSGDGDCCSGYCNTTEGKCWPSGARDCQGDCPPIDTDQDGIPDSCCEDLGGEPACSVHGATCAWINNACVCNEGSTGCSASYSTGGSSITVTCNSSDTGTCAISRSPDGDCFRSALNEGEAWCQDPNNQFVGCDSTTAYVSVGSSITVNAPSQDCGVWQIDAAGCGDQRALTGCNWSTACDTSPTCPDGNLDTNEECEQGNPSGNQCLWESDACNQSTCLCSDYLTISGEVYCQDDGGERYAIEGANIEFYKATPSLTENLTTNTYGAFQSAANTTLKSYEPFSVNYVGITDIANKTLPTGVPYEDMAGPVLDNPSMCPDRCSGCVEDYTSCSGLTDATNNPGFRWRFSNCGLTNPNWGIVKDGSVVCYEEGTANVYAEVSYTITVTNKVGGGTVDYVEDTFDPSIQDSWITSTTPTATSISGGKITWTLGAGAGDFAVGESKTFLYTVRIPEELLGDELNNHSVAHLSTGEDLHAYEDIFAVCGLEIPEVPLPGTGIFDNTAARIALGFILVGLGYGYYKFGLLEGAIMWFGKAGEGVRAVRGGIEQKFSREAQNERWERRMMKDVDRNRNRRKSRKSKK